MSTAVFPIGFAVPSVSVREGENISVEIVLHGGITRPLSVRVETEDLTTSPGDYAPLRQTVTFQPPAVGGNTTAASETVTVSTTSDEFGELTEEFIIVLSQPSLGLNITESSVTVSIVDSTGKEWLKKHKGREGGRGCFSNYEALCMHSQASTVYMCTYYQLRKKSDTLYTFR